MKRIPLKTSLIAYLIAIVPMVGCSADKHQSRDAEVIRDALDSQKTPSANYYLTVAELAEFRPGRERSEILKSLNWRGDLFMMAELDGTATTAIGYTLFGSVPEDDGATESVYVIFENDKFVKFVTLQAYTPYKAVRDQEGGQNVDDVEKRNSFRMGDARALRLLAETKPASVEELQQAVNNAEPSPRQIDPGLTAVVLGMKALGIDPIGSYPEDYRLNARMRDQFNASRLRIGMTQQEIDELFKSKPLAEGNVEGGKYVLFGKFHPEAINVQAGLEYANVLTLFDEAGHLTWAIPVSPYEDWREQFDDFATER